MNTLLSILLLTAVIAAPLGAQESKYPLRPAPIQAIVPPLIDRGLFWVDNDSLIFQGIENPPPKGSVPESSVVLWNTRTSTVKSLGPSYPNDSPFLCFSRGFLTFPTRKDNDAYVLREGAIDSLIERRVPFESLGDAGARRIGERWNRFTCKNISSSDLGPRGRYLVPLRDGDGFLDFTGGGSSEEGQRRRADLAKLPRGEIGRGHLKLDDEFRMRPAVHLATAHDHGRELPMRSGEVYVGGPSSFQYSEWSRQYVFPADSTVPPTPDSMWPKGAAHPVYLLSSTGGLQRIDVPYTSELDGRIASAVLTRTGLMVVSRQVGRSREVGNAGIYRVTTKALYRVFKGFVNAISVSPDGCRIAANARNLKAATSRVYVIDVCRAE